MVSQNVGVFRDIINVASKGWPAEEKTPRAHVRSAIDLLLPRLKLYAQAPAGDDGRHKQHKDALLAVAQFLEQIEPDEERLADRFAMRAQEYEDAGKALRVPTAVCLARAEVARAIKTLCKYGVYGSRKDAIEWAIEKYPALSQLNTEERSPHHSAEEKGHRSGDLKRLINSWCKEFKRGSRIKCAAALRVYSEGLDALETRRLTRNQAEKEAHRLLKKALYVRYL